MKHIKVGDLMTAEVVSVVPTDSFKDVAKLLAQHNISGLPVLDSEDRVLGVISESDLLVRQTGSEPTVGASPDGAGRPTPTNAGAVMSSPAVTVFADESVSGAARLMTRRGVERLPVVDEESRLVGIVTRRDLLGLFLRPDAEIRQRVLKDVLVDTMGLRADVVAVHVVDGVVRLEGELERQSEIPVLIRLTEQLDGVVAVMSHLTARFDNGRHRPPERTAGPIW
jgi:CBS domain-containing protein